MTEARGAIVVVAGGSGVVGSRLVAHLLPDARVARVIAVGRRPLEVQHEKLTSLVVDLFDAAALGAALVAAGADDVDIGFCCLGTTMKQAGSRQAFYRVDHDAVVAFGAALKARHARRMLVVSAHGASSKSPIFYNRVKGETEDHLRALGLPCVIAARPGLLDDEGRRAEHRRGERIALVVLRSVAGLVGPRLAPIKADVVARALVALAFAPAAPTFAAVPAEELRRLRTS